LPNDRPTILQIIPRLDAGGAELSVVEIAAALTLAGARALVLAEPGRLTPKVAAAGGEVTAFPAGTKNPIRMLANARAILRLIEREGVDLVHARSRAPAWSALMAARRARIAFVTTYHGAYGETNALKRLYNGVMARGDIAIANSRYTAGLIAERHGTPRGRIEVIHRGVDEGVFDPRRVAHDAAAALRTRWDVALETPIILLAARLTSWKGQSVLIDAVARLSAAGHLGQAVAILAGDAQGRDDYVHALQSQISRHGLEGVVRLVGHVDDIAAAYLAAHVTVIASTEPEAFGRTVIEAAAMGCPVIATDIGAPPETVLAQPTVARDDMTGWLVPPGDAQALAQRIAEALTLPSADRAAIGARARAHVLAHFTVRGMQRRTLSVYDRLLGSSLERRFCDATTGYAPATGFPGKP
jgi:glycosyltransferase involved in cell wall biosynthesis